MKYDLWHKIGHTFITSAHQGYVEDGMRSNTLSAFWLAAQRGADMIETDARASSDGVMMVNHDPIVRGFDEAGRPVEYDIATTPSEVLKRVILARDRFGVQYMPTLVEALSLCYRTGMRINIDLKNGAAYAELTAKLVCVVNRIRHIFFGLVCRITEHHTLIARTDCFDFFIAHL